MDYKPLPAFQVHEKMLVAEYFKLATWKQLDIPCDDWIAIKSYYYASIGYYHETKTSMTSELTYRIQLGQSLMEQILLK